jgi:hypothetical protein
MLELSADWGALVLRDGVAFLSWTTTEASPFHGSARVYVQSVYLDAFLLSLLQLDEATRLADGIAMVMSAEPDAADAVRVEEALLRFRSRVWWTHVGYRESLVNELLRQAQEQQRTPSLVSQMTSELEDVARFLEARQLRTRESFARALTFLSAFLVVPALVYSAASTWADPSAALFGWSTAVALALGLVAWLGLRSYLRSRAKSDRT